MLRNELLFLICVLKLGKLHMGNGSAWLKDAKLAWLKPPAYTVALLFEEAVAG